MRLLTLHAGAPHHTATRWLVIATLLLGGQSMAQQATVQDSLEREREEARRLQQMLREHYEAHDNGTAQEADDTETNAATVEETPNSEAVTVEYDPSLVLLDAAQGKVALDEISRRLERPNPAGKPSRYGAHLYNRNTPV